MVRVLHLLHVSLKNANSKLYFLGKTDSVSVVYSFAVYYENYIKWSGISSRSKVELNLKFLRTLSEINPVNKRQAYHGCGRYFLASTTWKSGC